MLLGKKQPEVVGFRQKPFYFIKTKQIGFHGQSQKFVKTQNLKFATINTPRVLLQNRTK